MLLPTTVKAYDNLAPAKFYDGLSIEPQKNSQFYVVKENESLSAIAARYGYDYIKLAQWNDIVPPYNVVVGQKLKLFDDKKTAQKKVSSVVDKSAEILEKELEQATAIVQQQKKLPKKQTPPELTIEINNKKLEADDNVLLDSYEVAKNESLYSIASRFGVSVEELAAWNNLTSPDQLYAGQKLKFFKDKQKDSLLNLTKKPPKIAKNKEDFSEKTSIISINNKSMLKFYCHWPVQGKIIKNFVQTDGRGIEIGGKVGQAIKAAATGKVVAVSSGIYGHGSFIVIQHSDQFLTSYANNKRSLVKNGQRVMQDQVIAEMGQVGRNQPSLEFEIRKKGILVNPIEYLPKKEE
jgi:lipoprotein NlpD